jgi:hypothetical protein
LQIGATLLNAMGWVPDVFIGVSDGCRWGGNPRCVNRLTTWGKGAEAGRVAVPKWWISDHLDDAREAGPGLFESIEAGFRHHFVKRGLLATQRGHDRSPGICGATLFEVVPTHINDRAHGRPNAR